MIGYTEDRLRRLRHAADRVIEAERVYQLQARDRSIDGVAAAQAERIDAAAELVAGLAGFVEPYPGFLWDGHVIQPPSAEWPRPVGEPCLVMPTVDLAGNTLDRLTRRLFELLRTGPIKPDAGAG